MCFQFGPEVWYVYNRKKVPAVPESLLKRRKAFATMKAMRIKKMLADKKVTLSFLYCSPFKELGLLMNLYQCAVERVSRFTYCTP